MTVRSRVALFALGGTIASAAEPGAGATVQLTGEDLLAMLSKAHIPADLEASELQNVASGDLSWSDVLALRDRIYSAVADGVDGVVITQGTDTLEETSYTLDLISDLDVPIVFTGAMRTATAPGADGPANLLAAVSVAASREARGLGVLAVMNDEIHLARYVRKSHTSSVGTFRSATIGPIGYVHEGEVRICLRPTGRVHVPLGPEARPARIAAWPVTFNSDDALLRAIPGLGYEGAVLLAFGGGHLPSWLVSAVEAVALDLPLVLASRTLGGEMLSSTYAYPGSEIDLLGRGVIGAKGLDWTHSVVLLRVLVTAGVPRERIAKSFDEASFPSSQMVTLQP
jgi:L-asparaginase